MCIDELEHMRQMNDPLVGPNAATVERIWRGARRKIQRRRLQVRVSVAATIAVIVLTGTGTAAYAATIGSSTSDRGGHTAPSMPGRKLPVYYEQLSRVPGFEGGGFTDASQSTVFVRWHGILNHRATVILGAAAHAGQPITVEYVEYSDQQLLDDQHQLNTALHKAGIDAWSLGPNATATGIQVSGPTISASDTARINDIAVRVIPGIPVTVIPWNAGSETGSLY